MGDHSERIPENEPVQPPAETSPKRTPEKVVTTESERHGWGDDPNDGRRDRSWYENERPPHHE